MRSRAGQSFGLAARLAGRSFRAAIFAFFFLAVAHVASAQDTRLLVINGVGGEDSYTAQYHKWAGQLIDAMKKQGMADGDITYLDAAPDKDTAHKAIPSTRENVAKAFADVAAKSKAGDEVFVILIGHGNASGGEAAFNLPGPDLTASQYEPFLAKLADERVVFVNTAGSSGPFIDALKKPGRTIITATKTAGEREDTRFPEYFVQALTTDEADKDRNGRVSVEEAFEFATQKVKDAYDREKHIMTEHAVLEDGSQGKLASTIYLAPDKSKALIAQTADPELRALLEQQAALNRDIEALRVKKDVLPADEYDRQMEKLLTDLALKTREIRDKEPKK
jgi:hypothetical protein